MKMSFTAVVRLYIKALGPITVFPNSKVYIPILKEGRILNHKKLYLNLEIFT